MIAAALLVVAAFFAGMHSAHPAPEIHTVKVPVPVECREPVPDRPAMPTEELTAKPSLDQYVQASQAELDRREGYERRMRASLEACTQPVGGAK